MVADLELHDRVLRAAREGAGGTVCQHAGDGLLAMSEDPAAAVDAAAAMPRDRRTGAHRPDRGRADRPPTGEVCASGPPRVLDQGVADDERGEAREVAVGGPELRHAM